MSKSPSYRLHRASGQAVVTLSGKDFYLGRYKSAASREAYHRLLAQWESENRQQLQHPRQVVAMIGKSMSPQQGITVKKLVIAYWKQHAKPFYRKPDGTPTGTLACVRYALRALAKLYARTPAADFGPMDLQLVRQSMVTAKLARTTINQRIGIIRACFKWAVAHELVPVTTWQALTAVSGLKAGRSAAKESRKVRPVPDAHVDAVREHVSPQVWAVIQLQRLTGARSSEILNLRPQDIERDGEVWLASLSHHKTEHHGHARALAFGPKAQEILEPFLFSRAPHAYLFSPSEAEQHRRSADAKGKRREGQPQTPVKSPRKLRDHYNANSYYRAIERACRAAGVPHWHPHQLRHGFATRIRKAFGIEAAQLSLGHALGSRITELYAEAGVERVKELAAKIG